MTAEVKTDTAAAAPVWADVKVPLKFPIPLPGGGSLTELVLREPNAEQLEAIEQITIDEKRQTAQLRLIVATLAGVDPEPLKKLNARDYMALAEASGPLLEALGAEGKD